MTGSPSVPVGGGIDATPVGNDDSQHSHPTPIAGSCGPAVAAGAFAGSAFGESVAGSDLPELAGACVRDLAGTSLADVVSAIVESLEVRT